MEKKKLTRKQGVSASAFTKRQLKHTSKDFYSPSDLRGVDEKELRKEYTEMRDIAQKRLKRLIKEDPENKTIAYHPEGFKKLKDIKSASELRLALSEISRFINTPSSTIAGQKKINEAREKVLKDNGFLTGKESKEEKKALMHFVNYVEKTLNENIMYSPSWRHKIRDDRFKDMIRKGHYGRAYEDIKTEDTFEKWSTKDEETRQAAEEAAHEALMSLTERFDFESVSTPDNPEVQDVMDFLNWDPFNE